MTTTPTASPELPDLDRVTKEIQAAIADANSGADNYMAALIAAKRICAKPEGEAPQAAIKFALSLPDAADTKQFLAWWADGEFDKLRKHWIVPHVPEAVFVTPAAKPEGEALATDELTDDDKHLVARGMERWRKGIAGECRLPPAGWNCTRTPGHDGPCAAQQAVVFANDGREPDWDGYAAEELAQQAAAPGASIDTPEFRELLAKVWNGAHPRFKLKSVDALVAHIDGRFAPSAPGTPEAPKGGA